MNSIIVICGFSGSGKDSISEELKKFGYNFIVSTSSRPMRDGESQMNPYKFVSGEEFLSLIKDDSLLEYRSYDTIQSGEKATWYYGVEKSEVKNNKAYVVVLDIWGLQEFKRIFGDRVKSFFIQVSDSEREDRAKIRGGFEKAEWDRRLNDDRKVFSDKIVAENTDYIVENYNFEYCIEDILYRIEHGDRVLVEEMEQ